MPKHLTILKSISTKPDPDHTLILAYMYYADKQNHDNSQYRYEVRIEKDEDLKKEIEANKADCVGAWTWPGIPDMTCKYAKIDMKSMAAKWLQARLKKAVPFEEFQKQVSVKWSDKGWVSEGYKVPGSEQTYSLKGLSKDQILALGTKRLSRCSKRAESTKKNFLDQPKLG